MKRTAPASADDSGEELLEALPAHDVPIERVGLAAVYREPVDVLPADAPLPVADVLPADDTALARGSRLNGLLAVWRVGARVVEGAIGIVTLIAALAVLAALPVLQFLSLGYLLEAGGRVGRTGRLRDGFIGIRIAARAGTLIAGTWLMLLPLRFIAALARDAEIIEPGSPVARGWKIGLTVGTALMVIHIGLAIACGGRLRNFFLPIINPFILGYRILQGHYFVRCRDAVWDYAMSLRVPYYFWLGLRGFAGGFVWLVIPVSLLALGRVVPPAGFLGAALLILVLLFLPFLQMHMVARNRFRSAFDVLGVAALYSRAPFAFAISSVALLLLAVPLYLLKIEMVPREVAWIPSVFFIVSIFPSRLLTGWAYARASCNRRRNALLRWFGGVVGLPVMFAAATFYVIVLFFSQYTSWGGVWSLYEQHAFLLPVPFLGM